MATPNTYCPGPSSPGVSGPVIYSKPAYYSTPDPGTPLYKPPMYSSTGTGGNVQPSTPSQGTPIITGTGTGGNVQPSGSVSTTVQAQTTSGGVSAGSIIPVTTETWYTPVTSLSGKGTGEYTKHTRTLYTDPNTGQIVPITQGSMFKERAYGSYTQSELAGLYSKSGGPTVPSDYRYTLQPETGEPSSLVITATPSTAQLNENIPTSGIQVYTPFERQVMAEQEKILNMSSMYDVVPLTPFKPGAGGTKLGALNVLGDIGYARTKYYPSGTVPIQHPGTTISGEGFSPYNKPDFTQTVMAQPQVQEKYRSDYYKLPVTTQFTTSFIQELPFAVPGSYIATKVLGAGMALYPTISKFVVTPAVAAISTSQVSQAFVAGGPEVLPSIGGQLAAWSLVPSPKVSVPTKRPIMIEQTTVAVMPSEGRLVESGVERAVAGRTVLTFAEGKPERPVGVLAEFKGRATEFNVPKAEQVMLPSGPIKELKEMRNIAGINQPGGVLEVFNYPTSVAGKFEKTSALVESKADVTITNAIKTTEYKDFMDLKSSFKRDVHSSQIKVEPMAFEKEPGLINVLPSNIVTEKFDLRTFEKHLPKTELAEQKNVFGIAATARIGKDLYRTEAMTRPKIGRQEYIINTKQYTQILEPKKGEAVKFMQHANTRFLKRVKDLKYSPEKLKPELKGSKITPGIRNLIKQYREEDLLKPGDVHQPRQMTHEEINKLSGMKPVKDQSNIPKITPIPPDLSLLPPSPKQTNPAAILNPFLGAGRFGGLGGSNKFGSFGSAYKSGKDLWAGTRKPLIDWNTGKVMRGKGNELASGRGTKQESGQGLGGIRIGGQRLGELGGTKLFPETGVLPGEKQEPVRSPALATAQAQGQQQRQRMAYGMAQPMVPIVPVIPIILREPPFPTWLSKQNNEFSKMFKAGRKPTERKGAYRPSVVANVLGIKGREPKVQRGIQVTGLEAYRPIPLKGRRKK